MTDQIIESLKISILVILGVLVATSGVKSALRKQFNYEYSDTILLFAITVSLVTPFLTYVAIVFAKYYLSSFMFPIGSISDWITLLGSIFGGFITLTAVIFTKVSTQVEVGKQIKLLDEQLELISAQNELIKRQHQEEMEFKNYEIALHAIPLLRVELMPDEGIRGVSFEITDEKTENLVPKSIEGLLTLNIQNTSTFIARSLKITKFYVDRSYNEGFDENEPFVDYPPTHDDLTEKANLMISEIPAVPGEYNILKNFFMNLEVNNLSTMLITCNLEYRDYNNTLSHIVQTTSMFSVKFKTEIHRNIDRDVETEVMFTGLILKKQSESYLFIK